MSNEIDILKNRIDKLKLAAAGADTWVTDLTAITSAADDDLIHVIDVSNTANSPDGQSNKITKVDLVGVVGVGSTVDGNLPVWDDNDVEAQRDSGIAISSLLLRLPISDLIPTATGGLVDITPVLLLASGPTFKLYYDTVSNLIGVENLDASFDIEVNFRGVFYKDDNAPVYVTPSAGPSDHLIITPLTSELLTFDGSVDSSIALDGENTSIDYGFIRVFSQGNSSQCYNFKIFADINIEGTGMSGYYEFVFF